MSTPIGNNSGETMKWQTCSKKWHWTHEEDNLLTILVQKYGAGNWDYIAHHIEGRSGKSCRVRWINQLNPNIDKSPFTEEDHQKLLQLHQLYGNRWSTIATFFPGRTDNQLKNQYHVLFRSRSTKSNPHRHSPPTGFSHHGSPFNIPEGPLYEFAPLAVGDPIQMAPYPIPDGFGKMSSNYDGPTLPYSTDSDWLYPNNITVPYHVTSASYANSDGVPEQVETLKEHPFINFLGVENVD